MLRKGIVNNAIPSIRYHLRRWRFDLRPGSYALDVALMKQEVQLYFGTTVELYPLFEVFKGSGIRVLWRRARKHLGEC